MADGWLPEGFENQDVAAPGRLAGSVRLRVQAHQRRVKILRGGIALTALALILGAAPTLWRSVSEAPQAPAQQVAQMKVDRPTWAPEPAPSVPSSPAPQLPSSVSPSLPGSPAPPLSSSSSPEISIQKAGKAVELAWTGNPKEEYIVYRCTSPKFDRCAVAGVVKGTQWKDTGSDNAPVVFYKVEPKA